MSKKNHRLAERWFSYSLTKTGLRRRSIFLIHFKVYQFDKTKNGSQLENLQIEFYE